MHITSTFLVSFPIMTMLHMQFTTYLIFAPIPLLLQGTLERRREDFGFLKMQDDLLPHPYPLLVSQKEFLTLLHLNDYVWCTTMHLVCFLVCFTHSNSPPLALELQVFQIGITKDMNMDMDINGCWHFFQPKLLSVVEALWMWWTILSLLITIVTMKVHENHQIQFERQKVLIFNKGLTCLLVDNNILSIGLVMWEGGMWNHPLVTRKMCASALLLFVNNNEDQEGVN